MDVRLTPFHELFELLNTLAGPSRREGHLESYCSRYFYKPSRVAALSQ
jgi:hypothetical protein